MATTLETRAARRAAARTAPEARDYLATARDGWRIVSSRGTRFGHDRCGISAHRGVLHPDEYVNVPRLQAAVELRLGFTLDELGAAYRQGPKSSTQLELRARIDARFLELREAGGNMELLAGAIDLDRKTLGRAMARARVDVA